MENTKLINPLQRYKEYHSNDINILIHKICVPLIVVTAYTFVSPIVATCANVFYSFTYLAYDIGSKRAIRATLYMNLLYGMHILFRHILNVQANLILHVLCWLAQVIGHKHFEKNTPAFIDNLYDSFLFAPLFTYLETFEGCRLDNTKTYSICGNLSMHSKPSIIYFAGLFQSPKKLYHNLSTKIGEDYNHIFVKINPKDDCNYYDVLCDIAEKVKDLDIQHIVGYSFGGSMTIQLKQILKNKIVKDTQTILVSPGGFSSNCLTEKVIIHFSSYFYNIFSNHKWYALSQYPKYQNIYKLDSKDLLIYSSSDYIHYCNNIEHENKICVGNGHFTILSDARFIIKFAIQNNEYHSEAIPKFARSEKMSYKKWLLHSYFMPYHCLSWVAISFYNAYLAKTYNINLKTMISGFTIASSLWSVSEYVFHRFVLHNLFHNEHFKHHIFPKKESLIHTPMILVVFFWCFYRRVLNQIVNNDTIIAYSIFFPMYYNLFELTHYYSHKGSFGNVPFLKTIKHYHALHHKHSQQNYGFTSPLCDYLFGTLSSDYDMKFIELFLGIIPFYSFLFHNFVPDKSEILSHENSILLSM